MGNEGMTPIFKRMSGLANGPTHGLPRIARLAPGDIYAAHLNIPYASDVRTQSFSFRRPSKQPHASPASPKAGALKAEAQKMPQPRLRLGARTNRVNFWPPRLGAKCSNKLDATHAWPVAIATGELEPV